MKKKRIEDMTIKELKQTMERCREDINQIISNAPTPEIRHELATKQLEWIKKLKKEWTREEDPADKDDRLYHEEQDHIAMEKAKVDQKVHNHPLGTGFAHKDNKETK